MRARIVRLARLLVGLAATVAIVASVLGIVATVTRPANVTTDMAGNAVQPDDPRPGPVPDATPSGIGMFRVPSVGLDVPLGAMDVVEGTIDPPGFASAYWIRSIGVAPDRAAEGTVYVAMHSLRGGGVGPGNFLIDVDRERASLAIGDRIDVAGVDYRVTGARDVKKSDLAADDALWRAVPGRLVVITCLQRPEGGPSVRNVVIEAQRDGTTASD